MPPEQLGKYKILEEIGIGGMGTVYRGIDTTIDMEVAIKILHEHLQSDQKAVNRFFNDAKALGKLKHPHIVQIYATEMGEHYFVMELLKGEPLKKIITDSGPMETARVLGIIMQIADAIKYIHNSNLIHRDIKPHNIIVGENDRSKILDFGIAKEKKSEITTAGAILGTVEYMSPEQLAGEDNVDQRTDIYSLGVVLYEMVTAQAPFKPKTADASLWQVVEQITNEMPRRPIELNSAVLPYLDEIIMHCLAKDVNKRRGTMGELIVELETVQRIETDAISSIHSGLMSKSRKPLWKKPFIIGSTIAVIAGLIAGSLYLFNNPVSENESAGTERDASYSSVTEHPQTTKSEETLNVNTASALDLERIPGIGPVLAKKIIEYREEQGGKIKSVNDLISIRGVGVRKLEMISPYIKVE